MPPSSYLLRESFLSNLSLIVVSKAEDRLLASIPSNCLLPFGALILLSSIEMIYPQMKKSKGPHGSLLEIMVYHAHCDRPGRAWPYVLEVRSS